MASRISSFCRYLNVWRRIRQQSFSQARRVKTLTESIQSKIKGDKMVSPLAVDDMQGIDPKMQEEIEQYYLSRRKLAEMMGMNADEMTDLDVEKALRYLLPTKLSAREARPFLKNPLQIYPKRKESEFDKDGRPLDAAFYTGSPRYHNLLHELLAINHEISEIKTIEDADIGSLTKVAKDDSMDVATIRESIGDIPVKSEVSTSEHEDEDGYMMSNEEDVKVKKPSSLEGLDSDLLNYEEIKVKESGDSEMILIPSDQGEVDVNEVVLESESTYSTPMRWITKVELEDFIQESLSDAKYENLMSKIKVVAQHSRAADYVEFLSRFRRPIVSLAAKRNIPPVDKSGRALAVGRRKTSVAVVWLKRGDGCITVNHRPFIEYFPRLEDRDQIIYPFRVVNELGNYDVTAKVRGGGISGQTGALRLGISRALLSFSSDFQTPLMKEGLLIQDIRIVERKKPGQKKARKKFAWVKR